MDSELENPYYQQDFLEEEDLNRTSIVEVEFESFHDKLIVLNNDWKV